MYPSLMPEVKNDGEDEVEGKVGGRCWGLLASLTPQTKQQARPRTQGTPLPSPCGPCTAPARAGAGGHAVTLARSLSSRGSQTI